MGCSLVHISDKGMPATLPTIIIKHKIFSVILNGEKKIYILKNIYFGYLDSHFRYSKFNMSSLTNFSFP